jgi:hypothetical protein
MSVVVRCPSCRQLSRVAVEAVGLTVACPRCDHPFIASADGMPTVRPAANRPAPAPLSPPSPRPDPLWDANDPPVVHPHSAGSTPVAIALIPLGIPLLWLGIALIARPSVFSFAAPVAIAAGVVALGLGLAAVRKWPTAVRVRWLLALVTLAYLVSGTLYFAQPSWLEGVRAFVSKNTQDWREYRPAGGTFRVRVPGEPVPSDSPVPGWELTAVRVADPQKPVDVFVVAHGPSPNDLPAKAKDEVWFERVREAVVGASEAQLVREQAAKVGKAQAWDYELRLPGDATAKRVVRVIRSGGTLYYLAVDSPWVTLDAFDVRLFWDSFRLTPAK